MPHDHVPGTVAPRPRSAAGRAVALVLAALLGVAALLTASSARAHDTLVEASPGQDTVLEEPPTAVVLTFSAGILDVPTTIRVTTADGAVVAEGTPTIDGQAVRLALPQALPNGDYDVTWSVVSSDGHRTEDGYAFTIVADEDPQPAESATGSTATTAPSAPTAEPTAGADADAAARESDGAGWMPSWTTIVLVQAGIVVLAVAAALAHRRWWSPR